MTAPDVPIAAHLQSFRERIKRNGALTTISTAELLAFTDQLEEIASMVSSLAPSSPAPAAPKDQSAPTDQSSASRGQGDVRDGSSGADPSAPELVREIERNTFCFADLTPDEQDRKNGNYVSRYYVDMLIADYQRARDEIVRLTNDKRYDYGQASAINAGLERIAALEAELARLRAVPHEPSIEKEITWLRLRGYDLTADLMAEQSRALAQARAALAVPREPTQEMLDTGWQAVFSVTSGSNHLLELWPVWRAMYDAALASGSNK